MGWGSVWPKDSRGVGGRSPSRSRGRVGCVRRMLNVRGGVVSLRGQQEGEIGLGGAWLAECW